MRPEVAAAFVAAFVAGLFGLVPLMVQIATTRARRRDRMTRLNQLQAEIEFLERLHALEGKIGTQDETAGPRSDPAIGASSLRKLWDQYNKLSEIAPSAVAGDKQIPTQQHSLLRRAFLLYTPQTTHGWIVHTVFYILAIFWVFVFIAAVAFAVDRVWSGFVAFLVFYGIPIGIALFFIQRRARQTAARSAPQPEEPKA